MNVVLVSVARSVSREFMVKENIPTERLSRAESVARSLGLTMKIPAAGRNTDEAFTLRAKTCQVSMRR